MPEEYLAGYVRMLGEVSATGRRPTPGELDARRALGERAAEAGYGPRVLLAAHLAATRTALGGPGAPDLLMAAAEQALDAFAEGYEGGRSARREFIDDLLPGRDAPDRLAERAARFGLRPADAHTVAVARAPTPYADGGPPLRRLEAALAGQPVLLTVKDGHLVCVTSGEQDGTLADFARRASTGALVAIGRPHPGVDGIAASYAEALGTLDVADRLGFEGPLLRAADLLVFPVLTRDRAALADLVLTVLGPLRAGRGGATPLLDTLTAYFDAGCVAAEAARRLNLSVRALTYRLERIHRLTTHDPADPAHRYTLQTATLAARLLNWPTEPLSSV
ncbi:helix-turn-helix domain-containing protein [Streptomyces sp. NPDC029216]|uniref:PucR family transcriptional regulator n=1 Tax=Streptomyces sp. NPDC029216 TaxID=3154701 RepID=UPI003404B8F9